MKLLSTKRTYQLGGAAKLGRNNAQTHHQTRRHGAGDVAVAECGGAWCRGSSGSAGRGTMTAPLVLEEDLQRRRCWRKSCDGAR